jgi:HSP20 family protein
MRHLKWDPPVDLYQIPSGWALKVDLAGVGPADVEVELNGRELRIRGERRDRSVQEGWRHYSMEIQYDRFERVVRLPKGLQDAQVTRDFRDGMLVIRLQGPERGNRHG